MHIRQTELHDAPVWWIQSVYVREDFRERGLFHALFAHVKNLTESKKTFEDLRLYMHNANARARRVYEWLGLGPTCYEVLEMDFHARP